MEYVILIIVIAVLAVATGGWLLFVRPRGGRTLEAPKPQTPPAAQATTTPAGSGDAESSAVPDTPAAATGCARDRAAAAVRRAAWSGCAPGWPGRRARWARRC